MSDNDDDDCDCGKCVRCPKCGKYGYTTYRGDSKVTFCMTCKHITATGPMARAFIGTWVKNNPVLAAKFTIDQPPPVNEAGVFEEEFDDGLFLYAPYSNGQFGVFVKKARPVTPEELARMGPPPGGGRQLMVSGVQFSYRPGTEGDWGAAPPETEKAFMATMDAHYMGRVHEMETTPKTKANAMATVVRSALGVFTQKGPN